MQKIIDISHYQTVTDWNKVKASADAVILKATQGHSLSGNAYLFTDRKFHEYAKASTKYQIPFGAYHFFTASTKDDAIHEADYFAKVLKPYTTKLMYAVCDAENYNNKWLLGLSRDKLSELVSTFCARMEYHGYFACHYTNTDHIQNFIDLEKIPYPVWQAQYVKVKPNTAKDKLIAWQYTNKEKICGIREAVDASFGYISDGEFAIIKLAALDVINTPSYWRRCFGDIQYLDVLLRRAAGAIEKAGTPCATLDEALSRLRHAGVVDTPEYWKINAPRYKSLDELIKKLGGAL